MTALEHIKFKLSQIRDVDILLEQQSHLKYLDLSGNFLTSLPNQTLKNKTQLKTLILADNQLKDLPTSVNDLKALEYLDLSNNYFKVLVNLELPNLKGLNLNNNDLIEISNNNSNITNLIELEFCKQINIFENENLFLEGDIINILKTQGNLKRICFNYPPGNPNYTLKASTFQNLENVTVYTKYVENKNFKLPPELKLSRALKHFQFISDLKQSKCEDCQSLFENNSNLSSLSLKGWIGYTNLFDSLSSLEALNLEDSFFINPAQHFTMKNQKLRIFTMNNIDMQEINNNLFKRCPKLVKIDMINCRLKHIDENAFVNQHLLTELNLYLNNLNTLSNETFKNLGSLKTLNLERNFIQILPDSIFKYQKNLEFLNLANNELTMFNV